MKITFENLRKVCKHFENSRDENWCGLDNSHRCFAELCPVSRPTKRAADGAESLEPQWICMTCKTVIGPVVDDYEHRCNCKDDYLIDLWRVAPVVESPRH